MMSRYIIVVLLVALLGACQTADKKPALLTVSKDTDRALLLESLKEMLNGADIIIANSAFMTNSEIIVERKGSTIPERSLGRDYSRPDHFRLWIRGRDCLLEHVEAERVQVVFGLDCVENSVLNSY